jgi:hypothetical protein
LGYTGQQYVGSKQELNDMVPWSGRLHDDEYSRLANNIHEPTLFSVQAATPVCWSQKDQYVLLAKCSQIGLTSKSNDSRSRPNQLAQLVHGGWRIFRASSVSHPNCNRSKWAYLVSVLYRSDYIAYACLGYPKC